MIQCGGSVVKPNNYDFVFKTLKKVLAVGCGTYLLTYGCTMSRVVKMALKLRFIPLLIIALCIIYR